MTEARPPAKEGVRLNAAQRLDWLRLIRSESVGPQTFRALINRHQSAAAALDALPRLAIERGKPIRVATREEAEQELEALEKNGAQLIAIGEPDYPATLRAIHAAPPLLAVRGDLGALRRPMVAFVGSRNASAAGLAFTERLAREFDRYALQRIGAIRSRQPLFLVGHELRFIEFGPPAAREPEHRDQALRRDRREQ